MAQPVWQTPAGSLGVIPESVFYQQTMYAYDPDGGDVYYRLIAGTLPEGIQCSATGLIAGVPLAVASLQGVPTPVNQDVTNKFVLRAYTEKTVNGVEVIDRIADRTFSLTITGNDVPEFITPAGSLGTFYDSDQIDIQIDYTNNDPGDLSIIRLVSGELPGGLTVSETGLISGYIAPTPNVDAPAGYDITAIYTEPYDFVVSSINKNFQFTLEVSDGKSSNLRTFTMFVYDRAALTADNTDITADNTFITADETPTRAPFLLNATPSNLGTYRSDNYYAYQFRGYDYDQNTLKYAISVNEGAGFAPGITLDQNSGWYYGFIPDQGTTEVTYSFNITVYESGTITNTVTVTNTTAGTNRITCNSTVDLSVGTPLVFLGTTFGGIATNTVYYVLSIPSLTQFTVGISPTTSVSVPLLTASGSCTADEVVCSQPYPFSLTITGNIDAEVAWLTNSNLGTIVNGQTSTLRVEATNRGGRELSYRLKSGAFNELPQGLQLLPSGEIAGRVSFNTFAVDLGATTFDRSQSTVTRTSETTFDSSFTFTVNAYAEDTGQLLYKVKSVNVVDGGTGYSAINTPTIVFNTPVGASAVAAEVGTVTVLSGEIISVDLSEQGSGYTSTATITITQGYGGSDAILEPVMAVTGTRDVVSVFKTFTLRLFREYNKPYQNLLVQAMPPPNDRALVESLLSNEEIFIPEYIYRPDDPNFGKATKIMYQHAFGLAPETIDTYVESLYLNHYWKNLVLGQIETAQALDADGNVLYEVVYSKIQDNLVNSAGESVSKIVSLPYAITDPADGSTQISTVYPNSLVNMRDQVIDVVGQISQTLPQWMTSKQTNGRVLGFTPAWVLCYTQPGRSAQIAYYLQQQFGEQLNKVDFKVDRYILDRTLSRNWDTETQSWTPTASLTTFDRYSSPDQVFIGYVDIATNLPFADVNFKTQAYIAALGGLDGQITQLNGKTLIFAQQENYAGYPTTDAAWQKYTVVYDSGGYAPETSGTGFDASTTVPGGYDVNCTATTTGSNRITCTSTVTMNVGDPIWFSGTTFGGIQSVNSSGVTEVYYVLNIVNGTQFTVAATASSTTAVTLSSAAGTMTANFGNQRMAIWTINVDPATTLVTLTLNTKTAESEYVQVREGLNFAGSQLYYTTSPPAGLTRVTWLALPESSSTETTFDFGSMAFEVPLDMYDTSDSYDKYLVFPRTNILV